MNGNTQEGDNMKLDTTKLADMGYGDMTREGAVIELTAEEIMQLATDTGGTVTEIVTAEVL